MKFKIKIVIFALLFMGSQLYPCRTKVSEWTMLNIHPQSYQLVYFFASEPDKKLQQKHEKFKQSIEAANIRFQTALVTKFSNDTVKAAFEKTDGQNLPFYALYYRDQIFAQFTSLDELNRLTTSPLRTTIADELTAGKLCVLLYLKSGEKENDQRDIKLIQKAVNNSIAKNIVPIINLSRADAEEQMFIKLLLKVENDLEGLNQSMLFGIFGRFRVLEPLVGKGITSENINYLIRFLTADCSCLIKDQMPGMDMLYLNEWENIQPALLNNIITE